ncbi:serine/threonine protein kinase [Minicystis rosea]|nr:serine/threonine protein kinase [Minicystis rosea]
MGAVKQGDVIAGRYRLLRPVGTGAMGTVWAARHELLGREFALKIAGAGERTTRDMRALFLREVQIVGKLRHPNIVDIADAGEVGPNKGLYLAMELLQGESLAARIARGPVPPTEAVAIAAAVGRGLAAAHEAGVVHRDLKPENIFLAKSAAGVVPKLLDFGVSSARDVRTIGPGLVLATPAYMSPERALGEDGCDARTDIWALGVVLYEMLTGRHPFTAASYAALLPKIIESPYPPLPDAIPREVSTVVAGCLAKDRADRYPNAEALLEALDRARAVLPALDPMASTGAMFVETIPDAVMSVRGAASTSTPRSPRHGLAVAILAVPVAIAILVAANSVHRSKGAAAAAPPQPPPVAPPVASTAPVASAEPPVEPSAAPSTTATAKAAASARAPGSPKAPRVPGRRVTNVDNAGF